MCDLFFLFYFIIIIFFYFFSCLLFYLPPPPNFTTPTSPNIAPPLAIRPSPFPGLGRHAVPHGPLGCLWNAGLSRLPIPACAKWLATWTPSQSHRKSLLLPPPLLAWLPHWPRTVRADGVLAVRHRSACSWCVSLYFHFIILFKWFCTVAEWLVTLFHPATMYV